MTLIVTERATSCMAPELREICEHDPTLNPKHFRKIARLMRQEMAVAGFELAVKGEPVDDLMLVFSDRIGIEKQGTSFPIPGPVFGDAEIALLIGCVERGCLVVRSLEILAEKIEVAREVDGEANLDGVVDLVHPRREPLAGDREPLAELQDVQRLREARHRP